MNLDSDSDGIPDATEARATGGYVAYTGTNDAADSDDDGILDIYDSDSSAGPGPGTFGSTLSLFKTGTNTPNDDSDDSDEVPDYLDTDSDGDAILDSAESGTISGVSFVDPDGSVNNPSTTLTNSDNDPSDVDFRSLNLPT